MGTVFGASLLALFVFVHVIAEEAPKEAVITEKIYFDIQFGDQALQRIEIGLYGMVWDSSINNDVCE